jgi:hypothetical protein
MLFAGPKQEGWMKLVHHIRQKKERPHIKLTKIHEVLRMTVGHSGAQFHVTVNCRNHIELSHVTRMTLPVLFLSQPSYNESSHNTNKRTCQALYDLQQRSSQLIIYNHQSSIFPSNFTSFLSIEYWEKSLAQCKMKMDPGESEWIMNWTNRKCRYSKIYKKKKNSFAQSRDEGGR